MKHLDFEGTSKLTLTMCNLGLSSLRGWRQTEFTVSNAISYPGISSFLVAPLDKEKRASTWMCLIGGWPYSLLSKLGD